MADRPWGGPWGGYGPAPYGGGPHGMPRYSGAVPPPVRMKPTAKAPAASAAGRSEIDALKQRIRELESRRQQQPPASPPDDRNATPPSRDGGSELIFRPMDNV